MDNNEKLGLWQFETIYKYNDHTELIMNQIRAADDILELPDWTHENEPCQILTLNESLTIK